MSACNLLAMSQARSREPVASTMNSKRPRWVAWTLARKSVTRWECPAGRLPAMCLSCASSVFTFPRPVQIPANRQIAVSRAPGGPQRDDLCRFAGFVLLSLIAVGPPCRLEVGAVVSLPGMVARLTLLRPYRVRDNAERAQHGAQLALPQLVWREIALHTAELRPAAILHVMQRSNERLDGDAVDTKRIEHGANVPQQNDDRVFVAPALGEEHGSLTRERAPRRRTSVADTD